MDARELTKKYYDLDNKCQEMQKTVSFLEMEISKLKMLVDDLRADVKMMQNERR